MAAHIEKHSTEEWLKRLDAADMPCAPILRRGEVMHIRTDLGAWPLLWFHPTPPFRFLKATLPSR